MKTEDIAKITLNDFLIFENKEYLTYSKVWDMDEDIIYVGLESREDFDKRYEK